MTFPIDLTIEEGRELVLDAEVTIKAILDNLVKQLDPSYLSLRVVTKQPNDAAAVELATVKLEVGLSLGAPAGASTLFNSLSK